MTVLIPVDAWARLAAAAGYNARGTHSARVVAEHHLGMFLSMVSQSGNAPLVTMDEAMQMMQAVFSVARGDSTGAPPALSAPQNLVCSACGRPWRNDKCSYMPDEHRRFGAIVK